MAQLFTTLMGLLAAWAIVSLVTSSLPRNPGRIVLQAGLALGVWLGMESCLRFAWLVSRAGSGAPGDDLLEAHGVAGFDGPFEGAKTLALFSVACVAAFARRREAAQQREVPGATKDRVAPALLAAFAVVLAVAVVGFVYAALAEPNGGDDAQSIWNLHAKFLYFGGADWERPFVAARNDGAIVAWHLDYPLGLPSIVTGAWIAWGRADPWLGWSVAGLFTLAALLVTVGGVSALRGINQGLLAGVALLGAVGYVHTCASQYADAPLSLFFVAALICLLLGQPGQPAAGRWLALCGWFTGLAAWTKNEGLLFALCIGVVAVLSAFGQRGPRGVLRVLVTLLIGAAPALACLAWFKWNLAPQNDLLAGQAGGRTIARLTDPQRYWQIAQATVSHYFNLGKVVSIAAPLYWIFAGTSAEPVARRAAMILGAILALMVCGFFAVYLITPRDLAWHLSSSMSRLAAQLWPSLIALIFLASRSIDAAPEQALPPGPSA